MKDKIEIVYGDICEIEVDAIICQANTELELEDPITKKIIERGGESIQIEYHSYVDLQKGDAIITTSGDLPTRFLIHAVINNMGEEAEEEKVMLAIRNALQLAYKKNLTSIAIPLLGGSIGIPIKRAAELILAEVKRHLEAETSLEKVIFVLEDYPSYNAFEEGFRQL